MRHQLCTIKPENEHSSFSGHQPSAAGRCDDCGRAACGDCLVSPEPGIDVCTRCVDYHHKEMTSEGERLRQQWLDNLRAKRLQRCIQLGGYAL
ncbi:MAG: hypothetical protein ACYCW6_22280 [Candidatus Xenobia bacterium]